MEAGRQADIAIIGAGPVALFSVFQLGLFGFKCDLIEVLDRPGGQCTVLYPDKPIFDVPAFPEIAGDELTNRLLKQITPYRPKFHFGQIAESLEMSGDRLQITTNKGTVFNASAVVIAAGLGCLEGKGQIIRPDPLAHWNLRHSGNAILVDPASFATSCPGVYAIGDACHYPGKLKLILSGFHEAALMTQSIRQYVRQISG